MGFVHFIVSRLCCVRCRHESETFVETCHLTDGPLSAGFRTGDYVCIDGLDQYLALHAWNRRRLLSVVPEYWHCSHCDFGPACVRVDFDDTFCHLDRQ